MIIKSFDILKNSTNFLKHNFFLLYGENTGLKKDIRWSIKTAIEKNNSNVELLSLYEIDIISNEENFYNSIYSGSLFSNTKIITISNATDKIVKQLEDAVNKKALNIFLIIFSDILEKKSKLRNFFVTHTKTICIPCYLDNDRDLEIIAKTELNKNNIIISRESINLLVEKSNNDRGNLKNEIDKIKSFAIDKKNLKDDEMKYLINFSGEHKSDGLINECLCGNISQYKKILSEIYTNTVNQTFYFRILSNKIQRLLKMKKIEGDYSSLDNLLNASKPPIFWKEKPIVKKQLTIWSLDDLKKIINEINDVEILCRKKPQISKIIFFNFFSKLCKKASSYS